MKPTAFPFVIEELSSIQPVVKPMFGAHGVYRETPDGLKILFILRDRADEPEANGVWIATSAEHHDSLRKDLPIMTHLSIFGPGPTNWQNLPTSDERFEEMVLKACALALKDDHRIGRIPKARRPRPKSSKKVASPSKKLKRKKR